MSVLRRLYRYLRPYRAWAVVAILSMIVVALTQVVFVALVQPLVDDVLTPPGAVKKVERTNTRMAQVEAQLRQHAPAVYRVK
ncbi:MAG TPA: hypothetical protein VF215_14605, partial [Thermoanaerobaculia bacterium]